jgi:predicted  nucleic acid-binding Zn-ribbon protein
VEENTAESTPLLQTDVKTIEVWLKGLWDRARKASELITRLRDERAELHGRVAMLEQDLARVKDELSKQQELVQSLSSDHKQEERSILANGEREVLSSKVRELLAKLDEYI